MMNLTKWFKMKGDIQCPTLACHFFCKTDAIAVETAGKGDGKCFMVLDVMKETPRDQMQRWRTKRRELDNSRAPIMFNSVSAIFFLQTPPQQETATNHCPAPCRSGTLQNNWLERGTRVRLTSSTRRGAWMHAPRRLLALMSWVF
jgi:hypothetical protein